MWEFTDSPESETGEVEARRLELRGKSKNIFDFLPKSTHITPMPYLVCITFNSIMLLPFWLKSPIKTKGQIKVKINDSGQVLLLLAFLLVKHVTSLI